METIGLILMAIIVIVGFWAIYRAGVASDKLSDRLDRCEVRLDMIEENKDVCKAKFNALSSFYAKKTPLRNPKKIRNIDTAETLIVILLCLIVIMVVTSIVFLFIKEVK